MTEQTESSAAQTPADGDGSTSKAGRNLPAAIGVGVGLGAIALVTLFTFKWLFAGFALLAVGVGIYEVINAFRVAGVVVARTPIYLGAVATVIMAYLYNVVGLVMVFGLIVISTLIWRVRRGTDGYVKDVTATVFTAAYLPFMLGFAILTLAADDGPKLIVTFVLLTVCNDIGGYATGVLFGKHPIAPGISPKKSWEGFAGSVTFQAIVGALLFEFLLGAPWWQGVIAGVLMAVTATAGDFAESAIKRDLGVKDLGNILPGHGGVMDRLDSLIPNAFVSWLLFAIFGLIAVPVLA
ncbi:MAG: phosphatidate cytidylyltransferase [Actinobacteria bacterium]|nr:phosphatidate cytidylyltransferase [Actinomycetota bacterium]MCB9412859.1 phosphatidate cytidylyltransferase [Actinomycetota bacterium]